MSKPIDVNALSMKKLPPFDLEAEQAVLCAILLDNQRLFQALDCFSAADFYKPSHEKIFTAMLRISERGDAIDLLTLRDDLESASQLEQVGGAAYLAQLVDAIPTAANIEFHAKIIREKAILRRLLNIGLTLVSTCYEDTTHSEQLLSTTQQALIDVTDAHTATATISVKDAIQQAFERFELFQEGQAPTPDDVFTGYPDLDALLLGLHPGTLTVIAGRPGCGKTALACDLLRRAYRRVIEHDRQRNLPVSAAFYSLEMTQDELSDRLLCAEAKVNWYTVREGKMTTEDWERVTDAAEVLSHRPSHLIDPAAMTIAALRAHAKRMKLEHHIDLLLVDYAQLVTAPNAENRVQEVSQVSRGLKQLSKELHIPVIVLAQLNRDVEKRPDKRPQLSDLKDSGQLEQDASIVLFPFRPEYYFDDAEQGLAEIIVAKHRNGAMGTPKLRFFKEYACFENYTQRDDVPTMPERW